MGFPVRVSDTSWDGEKYYDESLRIRWIMVLLKQFKKWKKLNSLTSRLILLWKNATRVRRIEALYNLSLKNNMKKSCRMGGIE